LVVELKFRLGEKKIWLNLFNYIVKDLDNYLGFTFENLIKDYLIEQNKSKNSIFIIERNIEKVLIKI